MKTAYRWWTIMLAFVLAFSLCIAPAPRSAVLADSTAQTLPFTQDWSNTGLITINDTWTGVPGIMGYRGDNLTAATGTDPRTILTDGTGVVDVIANKTDPNTLFDGGVAEFEVTNPVIAIQGSGTADAPFLLMNIDTTGKVDIAVSYNLRDLDGSTDNAVQPVALQYRLGSSGDFTNIPEAYIADATQGPSISGGLTSVQVMLPDAAEDQPLVQLRIITTNSNGNDEWVGIDDISIQDNFDIPPYIVSIDPAPNSYPIATDTGFTITFNEIVSINDTGVYFDCLTSPESVWTNTYEPSQTFVISASDGNLPAGEKCTLIMPYTAVFDSSFQNMWVDYSATYFTAGCGTPYTPVHDLQGTGVVTIGDSFIVEGVVTAYTPGLSGYFLQDASPDANPVTSEGIFVYDPINTVTPGERIRVYGQLKEYDSGGSGGQYNLTELSSHYLLERCDTGNLIEPAVLDFPLTADVLEAHEGMLVTVPETMTVQQNYFQGRFGQLTLGSDGRVFNPNDGQGGTPAEVVNRMLVLDDGINLQNPNPISFYAADGVLRAGDTVSGLTGVLDQGKINTANSSAAGYIPAFPNVYYRLHPTTPPVFTQTNPRSAVSTAPAVGGEIKVAGFNVLNFFTTLNQTPYPVGSPYVDGITPRGADSAAELTRQTAKLVAALAALNADVVGLTEIETWAGADAVNSLVNALNTAVGEGTYAAVADPLGFPYERDVIKVALIYKTASVTPLGVSMVDADAIYSRPPVAQTFIAIADNEVFSVVVNHLKSKSSCPDPLVDPDNIDKGQGCWNALRVQQATRLLTFIDTIKINSADPDVLVIGDLNAYGEEDPVDVLTGAGLTNLMATHVPAAERYSYVFDGQAGYLDHALATSQLTGQVTDAAFWHINADEPSHIDYNTEFKLPDLFTAHFFRASDHDPVLIGLNLQVPPEASLTSEGYPTEQWAGESVEFNLRLQNPVGGTAIEGGVIQFRITDALLADITQFEAYPLGLAWMPVYLEQDGSDVVGYLTMPYNVPIYPGYDQTVAVHWTFAKAGSHSITFTLVDISPEPDVTRASLAWDLTVWMKLFLPIIGR